MKWLFAILVALNIVVFGSMVAGKLVRDNIKSTATDANMSTTMPLASRPANPNISIQPDHLQKQQPASEIKALPAKADQENQLANKSNSKDNDDRKHADRKNDNSLVSASNNSCTATVSLPEDDFHRIKGLFSQWPFTVSRFVEKINTPKPRASAPRYAVTLPPSNDAGLRTQLQSQGFDYGVVQGQISLGVFNRRADAESLLARAKMHGFSDAAVTTLDRDNADVSATSVAKMRVVFTGINKAAINDINNVVSHYGRLEQSGACQ